MIQRRNILIQYYYLLKHFILLFEGYVLISVLGQLLINHFKKFLTSFLKEIKKAVKILIIFSFFHKNLSKMVH